MPLKIIDREEYLSIIKHIPKSKLKDVDIKQYSDYYYLLYHYSTYLAVAGIHDQKKGIRQVNGLVGLEKGFGAKLLLAITSDYLRLNCTRELFDKYYSRFGFEIYLEIDDYVECIKKDA